MTEKLNYHSVEHWRTIGVTALPPGYCNLYKEREGGADILSPCPALLLQELLYTGESWDAPAAKEGHFRRAEVHKHDKDKPCPTRVVFADTDEFGYLSPACDISNYDVTLAPGELEPKPKSEAA